MIHKNTSVALKHLLANACMLSQIASNDPTMLTPICKVPAVPSHVLFLQLYVGIAGRQSGLAIICKVRLCIVSP